MLPVQLPLRLLLYLALLRSRGSNGSVLIETGVSVKTPVRTSERQHHNKNNNKEEVQQCKTSQARQSQSVDCVAVVERQAEGILSTNVCVVGSCGGERDVLV